MADLADVLVEWALFHRAKGVTLPQVARKIGCTLKWVKAALEQADDEKNRRAAQRAAEVKARRDARIDAAEAPDLAHRQVVEARLRRELEYARDIRLNPKFPVGVPFTRFSECPHRGPIPYGSMDYCACCRFSECPHRGPIPYGSMDYCACCDKTGIDWRPAFHRDPHTEPRRKPELVRPPAHHETRKERRDRLHADLMANRSAHRARAAVWASTDAATRAKACIMDAPAAALAVARKALLVRFRVNSTRLIFAGGCFGLLASAIGAS